jgi:hypothetical protein
MMEFGFGGFGGRGFGGAKGAAPGAAPQPGKAAPPPAGRGGFGGGGPTWQQQVLAKGWGYAIISPNTIQADNGAGLTKGIIGLCNKGQPRRVDDWGALRAWAWGASRALDYFEMDKAVDAKQVGIEGLSRYGKAAIVAMAYDQRFAIGFIGSSGEGGAKLHRRNFGELVENVASTGEYHWMAGNFLKYAGPLTWDDLPVDSHELVAMCAPRPVFISVGSQQAQAMEQIAPHPRIGAVLEQRPNLRRLVHPQQGHRRIRLSLRQTLSSLVRRRPFCRQLLVDLTGQQGQTLLRLHLELREDHGELLLVSVHDEIGEK